MKIIILVSEDEVLYDALWLKSAITNTAFDFLADEAEDIHSLEDGKPFKFNN